MTQIAIETNGLTRRYRSAVALDNVTVQIHANTITGLLGRNGAGKTTLMSLITAQDRPSSGTVRVSGRDPFERGDIIEQMCFLRDNQRYPDDYKLKHAVRAASIFYPNWDQATADRLIAAFRIPTKTIVKKFSRGQLSALGIVLGLASRSPITFFDEPYLGLDATARTIFYDELLRDFAEHPRTIILSTHLIDEMDRLLERVIVIDQGKVVRHDEVDAMRGSAYQIAGKATAVDAFAQGRTVLARRSIGGLGTAVIGEAPTSEDRATAAGAGLEISAVSLQDLVAAYGLGDSGSENSDSQGSGNSAVSATDPHSAVHAERSAS